MKHGKAEDPKLGIQCSSRHQRVPFHLKDHRSWRFPGGRLKFERHCLAIAEPMKLFVDVALPAVLLKGAGPILR